MLIPEDFHDFAFDGGVSTSMYLTGEPRPKTYLRFSHEDLKETDTRRGWVNAVSNAKRALHFQVDLLSEAFGIKKAKLGRGVTFPKKLDFCVNCGIVGPRILHKLNALRNTVEHDYYLPEKEEAERFVDVVELFLTATDNLLRQFPVTSELVSGSKWLRMEFANGEGKLDISTSGKRDGKPKEKLIVNVPDGEIYFKWIRFLLSKDQM